MDNILLILEFFYKKELERIKIKKLEVIYEQGYAVDSPSWLPTLSSTMFLP